VRGVLLMALAAGCFATMDTSARYLGQVMPVLIFFWARYLLQAVSVGLWLAWRHGRTRFASSHPRFQIVRGLLLAATSAMSFYGVQYMRVPEFTAINMLAPLLAIVLAAWWLHEKVSPLRWALVAGGFVGALIVTRPGSGIIGWAAIFPLAGAVSYAAFQVLTRRLAGHENPITTHFYTGLVGTVLLTLVLLASPVPLVATLAQAPAWQISVMLLIGVLGTGGHLLLIFSLGMAPTAVLMPFLYLQIAFATLLGSGVFHQLPDGWALLGMGVITACGAAGAWLNLRQANPPVNPVQADTVAD